ncbi:hypothetical protein Bca4012_097900 [Brassica carinata]
MFAAAPASPAAVLAILDQPHISSWSGAAVILKLLMQVIVYNLWTERNHRIFRQSSSSEAAIISKVDRSIKDRLLSLPPPREGSISFLLLYLTSRSLFPP